jgi:beta-galactosidase
MRVDQLLNDGWKALPRPPEGFAAPEFDDSGWEAVRLPHTNLELPLDNFDPASFQFVTGYRKALTFDPAWAGHRVFLVFEAVMARAQVWVDGQLVAVHDGGYTPFEAEVPREALARGRATVAVAADAREHPGVPPFGHAVDYLTYGGIYREVHLEVRPARYLDTLTLETPDPADGHPRVRGTVWLDGPRDENLPPLVGTVRVRDRTTGREWAYGAIGWAPGASDSPFDLEVPGATPWDLDTPVLYDLVVETDGDRITRTFGFRQADFRPEGFFLNGRPVKLRGLNRHQSYPAVGYALPARAQAADADLVKVTLGCNMVRSSHYPPSRHFLDRCDQIGLLVFEEIPGWQHIGGPEWKAVALRNVEEMVLRDRHRPSVVLWGVRINESADDDEFYRDTNARARALDPTRPTGGVRNFAGSRLLEDVYTYNDFVHAGTNRALEPRGKVARRRVPYLVTEHNGHMFPTKKTDPEGRRTEHALRHARVQNAAAADPEVAGALGWCLADYGTHADFGSGDQICHHGVVDQFRCPKPAADFYASQRAAPPFGRISSRMAIGDHDGAVLKALWVFANSAEVRVFHGDRLVGTFLPDRRTYPALPHPPVAVDDLIGSSVEAEPGLSKADARWVKAFLLAYQRKGGLPGLRFLLPLFWVMVRRGWTTTDVYNLYTRHVAGWGAGSRTLRFEGWTAGTKEWEQTLGPTHAARLELTVDAPLLEEDGCWDVVRAEARLLDTHGNEVWYGSPPVELTVDGPLRILGPAARPLAGGSTAWWLGTTGQGGPAVLTVRTDRLRSAPVTVEVRVRGA